MRVCGCPCEARIYNSKEKNLDPRTISGYFIGYVKRSKGYKFYYRYHTTRVVESINTKFLENDLIKRSDQLKDLGSKIDYIESQPSTSSERLVVIHTPQVQRDDEQHMTSIPQPVVDNLVDQVDHQIPENDEQPAEQHNPKKMLCSIKEVY